MNHQKSFNTLSLRSKSLLVEDIGIPLCSIEFYDHRIQLYAFNNMFVEAWKNIETREVEIIRVAERGDLDKFLSRIILPPFKRKERGARSGW